MAEVNSSNTSYPALSNLSDKLHDQLDKFCNVVALLNCVTEKLFNQDESADDCRRVICIALGIISDVRNDIDRAALEASSIRDDLAAGNANNG